MRRARKTKGPKHLSLSATDEEWEMLRHNARRRDLSIARYVVGLVERDAGAGDGELCMTLSPAEQRELLALARAMHKVMLKGADIDPLAHAVPDADRALGDAGEEPGVRPKAKAAKTSSRHDERQGRLL